MANRNQIRSLLMPGIRQRGGRRGAHFTDEEVERIVDAYLAAPDGDGIKAAIKHMDLLARWPGDFRAEATRTAQHLATLKSVSRAYRKSAVHAIQARGAAYLQQQKDKQAHDDRKAAQDLARRAAQPQAAGGLGQGALPGQAIRIQGQGARVLTHYGAGTAFPGGAFAGLGQQQLTQQAPEPDLPKQVKAGEIVGWRAWLIKNGPGGYRLSSVAAPADWRPGQPMRGTPTPDGSAGVHAWKTRQQAEQYARGDDIVVGQVELWGKVIEHELGYRAEYGAIKSLDALELVHPTTHSGICGSAPSVLRDLQQTYGVPITQGTATRRVLLPPATGHYVYTPQFYPAPLTQTDFARATGPTSMGGAAIWAIITTGILVGLCSAIANKLDRRAAAYSSPACAGIACRPAGDPWRPIK